MFSHKKDIGYFFKGMFPRAISEVATFKMCNFPSGKFPKVRLGPLRRRRLNLGPERT